MDKEEKALAARLEAPKKDSRVLGMDLLKILSMFMVVLLHVNGHGGVIWNLNKPFTDNWYFANGVEFFCIVAVNLFAIISGYVYFGRKWKIKNLISLWLQVFFYSVVITVIFMICQGTEKVTWTRFWEACFPVSTKQYWYFSAYVVVFFAIPIFNLAIERFSKGQTMAFLGIVGFLLTVGTTVHDAFSIANGYNAFWLSYLYLVGAFVKKYDFTFRLGKKKFGAWAYFGIYLLIILIDIIRMAIQKEVWNENTEYGYTFPLHFLSSIVLFLCFSRIQIKSNKVITVIASAAFGVYIISEHSLIRAQFITDQFKEWKDYNPFGMVGMMLLAALIIYLICTGIELLRQLLFKGIQVPKLLNFIQRKADGLFAKPPKPEVVEDSVSKS